MLLVLLPAGTNTCLRSDAVSALARIGVTSIALVRDERSIGVVVEGWAFDPAGSAAAVVAALSGPARGVRALQPVMEMALSGRRSSMNRLMSVLMAVVAIVALSVPVAAAQAPIIVEFEKAPGGQGYFGLAEGGPGTIEMRIDDGAMHGNTQHFSATLWLTDTSAGTLIAEVSGQINLVTGRAVLNGVVTDGAYVGARVHEESQLVNPATSAFTGTVRIMPGS